MDRTMRPKILIVDDDDQSVREQLRLQLQALGYEVEVAEDAIQAGYALLRSVPNLIVCDVDMPYMSGPEFVAALRADPSIPRIPVIYSTEYLTNPLQLERLLDVIARQLHPRAARSLRESLAGEVIV
jgi:CheY-like chemotaxis protein